MAWSDNKMVCQLLKALTKLGQQKTLVIEISNSNIYNFQLETDPNTLLATDCKQP